jgi:isoleucyl-tRNA synthetase
VPQIPEQQSEQLLSDFRVVLGVRDAVTRQLEEARNEKIIGKPQEAALRIRLAPLAEQILAALPAGTLEELFIVNKVELIKVEGLLEPEVEVLPAAGEKCPRCWNIRELGSDPNHQDVCARCAAVLTGMGL